MAEDNSLLIELGTVVSAASKAAMGDFLAKFQNLETLVPNVQQKLSQMGRAVADFAMKSVDSAVGLRQTADATGLSTQQLQALRKSATAAGLEVDDLVEMFKSMQAAAPMLSETQVIERMGQAIETVKGRGQGALGVVSQWFGANAEVAGRISRQLERTGKSFRDVYREAQASDGFMSEDDINKINEADIKFRRLKQRLNDVGMSFVASLLPADKFGEMLDKVQGYLSSPAFAEFKEKAADKIRAGFDLASKAADKLVEAFDWVSGKLDELSALFQEKGMDVSKMEMVFGAIIVVVVALAAAFVVMGVAALMAMLPILLPALKIALVIGLITAAVLYLYKYFTSERWKKIWDAMKQVASDVADWFVDKWEAVKGWFTAYIEFYKTIWSMVFDVWKAVWNAVTDFIGGLIDKWVEKVTAVRDKVKAVFDTIKKWLGFGGGDAEVKVVGEAGADGAKGAGGEEGGGVMSWLGDKASSAGGVLKGVFGGVSKAIENVIGKLLTPLKALKDLVASVVGSILKTIPLLMLYLSKQLRTALGGDASAQTLRGLDNIDKIMANAVGGMASMSGTALLPGSVTDNSRADNSRHASTNVTVNVRSTDPKAAGRAVAGKVGSLNMATVAATGGMAR